MRVLLISPLWLDIYGYYKKAARVGCVSHPLGLTYLAGAVLNKGHSCKIVDMESQQLANPELINIIKDYNPGLIGITATTPVFNNAKYIAEIIKKNFPSIPLCIGGVHATIMGRNVLDDCEYFDIQVIGEGEETIVHLINAIENNLPIENIEGCVLRKNNSITENKKRNQCNNLDDLPIPARHLLNLDLYKHYLPKRGYIKYASLFTSRGCPFQCTFCSQHTMYGRKIREHSINRVILEIKEITQNLGINHIIIMDETMTLKKNRVLEICQAIKDEGLKFTWEGWTHASTIDEELLRAMKNAGLIRLSFGIESGNPDILKSIKKGVTLDQIRNAYDIAAKVGIETRGSAIIGHPFETKKTAWDTIKFCRNLKNCQQLFLNIACPYPGTELFEYAKSGRGGMKLLSNDYSKYKRYGTPIIEVNDLNQLALKRMQTFGLLYFYLTPKRIWYNIFKRSGIKAGIVNVFAFLKGILNSFFDFNKDN